MRVYARILRTPGVAMIVLATLIGRLPIGISGLAILLYVEEVSDSFAAAGLCAGALALGSAAGAPFQGRLIDRRGVEMLLPLAVVHATGLLAIWLAGEAGAPVALLAAVSLVTGASLPPVSSVLRSRWPYLLPGRPELLAGAFALDSVMIETIFVTGPLITTVVVVTVGPQYALIVSAACVFVGTSLMLAGLSGRPGPERAEAGRRAFGLGALASPGLRTLVLASLPVGFTFGTLEVVLPAFSEAEGSKEMAGVLLAVWSGASGISGLVWGARGGNAPLLRAHVVFAWLLPLCVAPLALAWSPLTMALLAVLAGLPIAPLIASRNQLVERVVLPGTATEAYTWPLTALVAGVALGAAAGGAVVEASSWSAGVVLAMAVGFVGAAVVVGRRRTLARPLAVSG
ncbi:MAG TPA: MFS transporter [Thermoleophilaceae bacterium]|nr:MFS transporter [Thermoleophilaceae bacterium]